MEHKFKFNEQSLELLQPDTSFDCSAWSKLGVHPGLAKYLLVNNMSQPTAIQKVALRSAMSHHSQILVAETGAGKSLAYLLPVINDIFQNYKAKKDQY